MGTETLTFSPLFYGEPCTKVKLNNPLMGTETLHRACILIHYQIQPVKLNNPLMGTETNPRIHQECSSLALELN